MAEAKDKEERRKYLEELGIEPKKVEEYPTGRDEIPVIEEGEEEKEDERRKEELEQYRETTGF